MASVKLRLRGRALSRGVGVGEALVSKQPLSFFGGVDAKTGMVVERGHPLHGACVKGRVLVFPRGKGSTVGSWVLYELSMRGLAPAAIVNVEADPVVAVGCIVARIPLVDKLDLNPVESIRTGWLVKVAAEGGEGLVEVLG
jgi:predicted aconitase with swiveling domain